MSPARTDSPRKRVREKPAREVALDVLYHVDIQKKFADLQLSRALSIGSLSRRDAALATELVNGTLRWRGRLDWILRRHVRAGLNSLTPWVLNVLRLGLYQMLFLDRIPVHAAVDESVKLAKRYGNAGAAGLVNAVLRKILREGDLGSDPETAIADPDLGMAVAFSHPVWMVERWRKRFGDEAARELLAGNNRTPALGLRVHRGRTDRESLLRQLAENGVEAEAGAYSRYAIRVSGNLVPSGLPGFERGEFFVQDEAETLVGELVAPEPGELILDLCAAPGGKATHLQEIRGSEGRVLAVDLQGNRLKRIRENLDRLRIENVFPVLADGRRIGLREPADRVLVDAPCSGLGVLGRRADARWRKNPESLAALLGLQRELLAAGASHLRPGGAIVYSVCSMEPEEGVEQIEEFLECRPDFALEDAAAFLPEAVVTDGMLQVFPHRHRTDGAFAARMIRRK